MLHKQYQTEQDKLVKLQNRKNEKSDFYNGIIAVSYTHLTLPTILRV